MRGVQHGFDILPLQALADPERLTEQMNVAMGRHHANEGDAPGGNRQQLGRDRELGGNSWSLRRRRYWAGVSPPSRRCTCWVLTVSCRRCNSRFN